MKQQPLLPKRIALIFLSLVILLGCVTGCTKKPKEAAFGAADTPGTLDAPTNTYMPPANEEGYLAATFPASLLFNKTAEEVVSEFQEDIKTKSLTPKELEEIAYWSNITANEDGSVNYYFTPKQYQRTREFFYLNGLRPDFFGSDSAEIIKHLEYAQADENGIPWSVTVWVDQEAFQNKGDYATFMVSTFAAFLGRYQVMCGVSGDQWSVHVTVRDVETNEVITDSSLPVESM